MRTREFLVLCALGLTAATAAAQPRIGAPQPPAVSPYLNLLRPGNSPGVNYYGLVRPQMEFRNNIQSLQQQVTGNQAVIADLNSAIVPTTGHKTSFLSTGGYFTGGARPNAGAVVRPLVNRNTQGAGATPPPRR